MSEELVQAFRRLRRSPAFSLIALATQALGIGASIAMFSLVHTILLRPLAYRDPGQLYTILLHIPKLARQYPEVPVNAWHLLAWRRECRSWEALSAIKSTAGSLTGNGDPERLEGVRASANLFRLLGVRPRLGRDFRDEEDAEGKARVVILSDELWRRRFGADPQILGRKILLDEEPNEVVGVLPPRFAFPRGGHLSAIWGLPRRIDFWRPAGFTKDEMAHALGEMNFMILGRMARGSSAAGALEEMKTIERGIAKSFPEPVELSPLIRPMHDKMVGDLQRSLWLLMGGVGCVLLIGCLNLANLMLVRANGRRPCFWPAWVCMAWSPTEWASGPTRSAFA